jgi:hypothetical protein
MFHRWAALVLVLALCAFAPKNAAGQSTRQQPPRGHKSGGLGSSYPNPFNPDMTVPFGVDVETCTDGSKQHVVTVEILNIIAQRVAVPTLQAPASSSVANFPYSQVKQRVLNMRLGCGNYTAYWTGNYDGQNKEAASGVYIVRLWIDKVVVGQQRVFNGK